MVFFTTAPIFFITDLKLLGSVFERMLVPSVELQSLGADRVNFALALAGITLATIVDVISEKRGTNLVESIAEHTPTRRFAVVLVLFVTFIFGAREVEDFVYFAF